MKILISFFIFLVSFFAPARAINFAIPTQVGSYSSPIEPIKPKAKTYKWGKKPITTKTQEEEEVILNIFVFVALSFIVGLAIFFNGLVLGLTLLLLLGAGVETLSLLSLLVAYLIIRKIEDWEIDGFQFISCFFVPIAILIKGLSMLVAGLILSLSTVWLVGIGLMVFAIAFFILLTQIADVLQDSILDI